MSVTFNYPITSPTNTITLRAPRLQNSNRLVFRTKHFIKMDSSVRTYKATPVDNKILMTFEQIESADLATLLTLIAASEGDDLEFLDWDANTWHGRLISNPYNIISEGDNKGDGTCDYFTFTLEFEGIEIPDAILLLAEDGVQLETENDIELTTESPI